MHKTVLAALPLTFLAIAVPVASADARDATSYRAALAPLGTSGSPAGVRGTARLRDGAKRDRVRLSVRGLARGQRYSWSVRKARAGGNACAGEVVGAFTYRALRKGRARAGDRSRGFTAAEGTSYAVVVSTAGGRDLACGELRTNAAPQQGAGEPGDDESALDDDSLDEDSLDDESVDDDSFDPDQDMPDDDEDTGAEDDDLDGGDDDF